MSDIYVGLRRRDGEYRRQDFRSGSALLHHRRDGDEGQLRSYGQEIVGIAKGAGVAALHANELGVGRLEDIAPEILRVIKKADARFFLSRLEKRYLAAAKVFDTYFDAGENRAVAWPHYWLKSLRLMFLFKLSAYVLDEEIVRTVWTSIITPNEAKSRAAFLQAARLMLARVSTNMQDARARQVICDGLHWALDNPEAFASPPLDKAAAHRYFKWVN